MNRIRRRSGGRYSDNHKTLSPAQIAAKRAREKPCAICNITTTNMKYCDLCGPEKTEVKRTIPYKSMSEAEQDAEVLRRVTALRGRSNGCFEIKHFLNFNTQVNV